MQRNSALKVIISIMMTKHHTKIDDQFFIATAFVEKKKCNILSFLRFGKHCSPCSEGKN